MPRSTAERSADYRQRQRAKGLRPVTLWVRDLRDPSVIADIQRQCRLIAELERNDPDWQRFEEASFKTWVTMLDEDNTSAAE
jgi:hypothetical protein